MGFLWWFPIQNAATVGWYFFLVRFRCQRMELRGWSVGISLVLDQPVHSLDSLISWSVRQSSNLRDCSVILFLKAGHLLFSGLDCWCVPFFHLPHPCLAYPSWQSPRFLVNSCSPRYHYHSRSLRDDYSWKSTVSPPCKKSPPFLSRKKNVSLAPAMSKPCLGMPMEGSLRSRILTLGGMACFSVRGCFFDNKNMWVWNQPFYGAFSGIII